MAKKKKQSGEYSAKDITVLKGLEPVRKRPGMYIGTTGPEGLHHLITEVFDNARDEAMADYADRIEVTLLPDNRVRVADNGRGIPVDEHADTGLPALEVIMTTLHAGGKFDNEGYQVSGGLHGVGVSVVNALSEWARAEVHRNGDVYVQEYERGEKTMDMEKQGSTDDSGTIIVFEADPEIFPEIEFEWKKILGYLRQQAYLVPEMEVTLIDARETAEEINESETFYFEDEGVEAPSHTFYFEGGLVSMIKHYNDTYDPVHDDIFYTKKTTDEDDIEVEIAFQYVDETSTRLMAFANNIHTKEGGTHITGFKSALTRTINNYAQENNILKDKDGNFTGEDTLEGLTAVISVKLPEVQFEGQTKSKLGTMEARGAVETTFNDELDRYLEENPSQAKAIAEKILTALRARKAAKAAKDKVLRKGALSGLTLPGKLADCQTRTAEEAELFIVEGDSAGGTAKTGRDRHSQAILPLRGKILNVERKRLDRMLDNKQIKNLVVALGTAVGDTFDIEKLRYNKIIIATDADVDGAHIRTLLLTLFYRYFEELLENGHIYIAQPPLYKIEKGSEANYFFTEDEKEEYLTKQLEGIDGEENPEEAAKQSRKIDIQRYKGLGEMNADELWETTMDPETRILKQVSVEDAQEADKIFDTLMGKDVSARKSFIQSNARMATIDV